MSKTRSISFGNIPCYLAGLSVLLAGGAHAGIVHWPSATAPCNTTLQACLDANPGINDFYIGPTAPVVTGSILLGNMQSLIGDLNARPRFMNCQIQVNVGAIGSLVSKTRIENLILDESTIMAFIGVDGYTATESLVISGLKFNNVTASPAVRIVPGATDSTRSVSISRSEINAPAALRVAIGFPSQGLHVGLYDNIIRSRSATTHPAINWLTLREGASLYVFNNRFESVPGNGNVGIAVGSPDAPTIAGQRFARIERNVFVGFDTPIQAKDGGGDLQLQAWQNSMTRFATGISVLTGGPGSFSFDLRNNIIANGIQAIALSPSVSVYPELTRGHNLYHATGTPAIGYESTALLANPQFRSPSNLRLQPTSPAINQGQAGLSPPQWQRDFDGVLGIRGSGVDIGAFEWTNAVSTEMTATASNISGNTAAIPSSVLSTSNYDIGFFQRVIAGDGAAIPADASKNLGIYRTSSAFRLFTEDQTPFPNGARFRILNPGSGTYARDASFVHRAINESGNPNNNVSWHVTTLPASRFPTSLGSLEFIRTQVVQRWDPPGSFGTYNNHAIGLYRTGDTYAVYNQDLAPMPNGAGFHVVTPAVAASYAFRVYSTPPTPAIPIQHYLLTDNECAHVYVSAGWGTPEGGTSYVPSPIVVRFNHRAGGGGNWVAVPGDGQNFAAHTTLNVYVDPEVANRCRETVF